MKFSSHQLRDFQEALFQNVKPDLENAMRDLLAISPDDFVKWIQDSFQPEEIFDSKTLEAWAERNGYIKEAT